MFQVLLWLATAIGSFKITSQNNKISLRRRFKIFAGVLVIFILTCAGYGYQRLSTTQLSIEANLVERNNLLEATHILRASLLDVYQAIDSFLLEPTQYEHWDKIDISLKESLLISQQLSDEQSVISEADKKDFYELNKILLKLEGDIYELIEVRLDSSRQYPSLGIGSAIMQFSRNNINNAFNLVINVLNGEEKLEDHPEILNNVIQARHFWTQTVSNFRMYLANRIGTFNEEALPIQEKSIRTLYREYQNVLKKLQPFIDKEILGFETTDAYEVLNTNGEKWFEGYKQVEIIHASKEWRIDAKLMKENITPSIELASKRLRFISDRLEVSSGKDITAIAEVASQQILILWVVSGVAILFVIFVFVSVESSILIPVGMIAKALKQEAQGKTPQELPTLYSNETKDLVEAFSEMSRQIHLRQSELEHRALHDGLTSLPNRTLLFENIEHDIFIAQRDDAPLSLLMIDLDLFKEVNDTFGHSVGDELLVEVGKRLKSILRNIDTVARMGGDEFAVLLPGAGKDDVVSIANKLLKVLQLPYGVNDLELVVSASVGISVFPEHGTNAKDLLQHADVAMYVAKQNNQGYSIYDSRQDKYSLMRFSMIADLREAIKNNSLELYFQPKLDLRSRETLSVEALLRWSHPHHGVVSPETIVELAEQTGFISQLTYWVADNAMAQLMQWQEKNINLNVSINISAYNLRDENFVEGIKSILTSRQCPCDLLTLEITENAMMLNPTLAIDTLTEFSDMGLGISVDDYGTGFSSLAYLSKLPVNELKIDKSFVMNIDTDVNNETIVRSTIELAHNLGLKVVAEGIENEIAWNILRSYGCDQAQGYYMSKPVPAIELEVWLVGQAKARA